MRSDVRRRSVSGRRVVARAWVLQLLVVCLVAPVLALAPSAVADAQGGYSIEAPQRLGIAANVSERLSFGVRASSNQVAAQGLAFLAQTCSGAGDHRRELKDKDELVRVGTATVKSEDWEFSDQPETVGPSYSLTDPGYRWKVTYCHSDVTTTTADVTTCVMTEVVISYAIIPYPTEMREVCTTVAGESTRTVTNTFMSDEEVIHPDADDWVKNAAEMALDAREGLDLDKVWWNSSPGYNSRQVIGLPTFFAASPVELTTETEYDWVANGFPLPLEGYGGDDPYPEEIEIILRVSPPVSEWHFDGDYFGDELGSLQCDTSGRLWDAGDVAAVRENTLGADLCTVSWRNSAVAEDSDVGNGDLVKLKSVQLIYPYELEATESARVIAELIGSKAIEDGGVQVSTGPGGEVIEISWGKDKFGTEYNGGSRELIVGEVQSYGVAPDGDIQADQGASESPWVKWEEDTCQKVGGWFVIGFLAGPVCKLVAGIINAHIAALNIVWDGVQLVATIAKVVVSGLWSLVKGCLSMVVDLGVDLWDTGKAFFEAAQDPGAALDEITGNVALISEQLSNPETRGDFVAQVLVDFGAELISLDMIMDRSEDGEYTLKENLSANDWIEWGGRLVCEVIAAFFGGKIKEAFKGTKFAERIQEWLTRRGINIPDINIPDWLECTVRVTGYARDAYELSVAAAGANSEPNSFPAGTLVLMGDGSYEPIDQISVGDVVLSYDTDVDQWEPQPVFAQWSADDEGQLATATLADGSTITATDGHLFWVESGDAWVELENVNAGDLLLTPTGTTMVVGVVEAAAAPSVVWELSVAENHNFAVFTGTTDVLVHNACPGFGNNGGPGGFQNPDGRPLFRQNPDGTVTYDSDQVGVEIDNVRLDQNGNPIVVKTDDFELVFKDDGTVTIIEYGPPVVVRDGASPNPDGSVVVENSDGTQTIYDDEGDSVTTQPTNVPFQCNSFPAGTEVALASGSYSNIEDIEPGDEVLTYDFVADAWVTRAVTAQWSAIDDGVIGTVELSDGSSVSATDHHRFWVNSASSWQELDQLTPGDTLFTPDGSPTVVDVSLSAEHTSVVWELTVEDTHNFTVRAGQHDVLVHNCEIQIDVDPTTGATTITRTNTDGRVETRTRSADGETLTVETTVPRHANGNGDIRLVTIESGSPPNQTTTVNRGEAPAIQSVTDPSGTTTITSANGNTTVVGPNGQLIDANNTTITPRPDMALDPDNAHSIPGRDSSDSPTLGIIELDSGEIIHLQSGAVGPAYPGDLSQPTATNNSSTTHVEGHAAAIMTQQGLTEMTITINHTGGPCSKCAGPLPGTGQVAALLPPGATLTVNYPGPNGTTLSQEIISSN